MSGIKPDQNGRYGPKWYKARLEVACSFSIPINVEIDSRHIVSLFWKHCLDFKSISQKIGVPISNTYCGFAARRNASY